ncbi:hypothetical protein Ae201684P_022056 [Aphanomyces euteiches]|nr:hypothetical protein Ae201684P_022056 [Aphanomyces euteiches]
MDPGSSGGYAVHASSEVPSPAKTTRPRKKHDDDSEPHHIGRKRSRREKDADNHHHHNAKILDERASLGEKTEHGSANGNSATATAVLPPGSVLFLTPSGRDEIMAGKSLLDLMRRTSRQKSKRREERADDHKFAVDDTTMVPQGLADKIETKYRDDFIGKISRIHSKPDPSCSTTISVPLSHDSRRSVGGIYLQTARDLLKPLIQRCIVTYKDEPVTADKNPLIKAMSRKIGLDKHRRLYQCCSLSSTRHRVATLAIVKTLFESNVGRLLDAWILDCLQECSPDMLHVIIAKLANSNRNLSLLQAEPHNLQWLQAWQRDPWELSDAGRQLVDLVNLEQSTDAVGPVTRAVAREALIRFGYHPHGEFGLFAEALRAYFAHATTFDSFPLLEESLDKFPPPYPNDPTHKHPVLSLLEFFKSTIPTSHDCRWFYAHLWPFLLTRFDLPTVQVIFRAHMTLVFAPNDQTSSADIWHALVVFVEALESVKLSTASEVLKLWQEEWLNSSYTLTFDNVMHMLCVSLGLERVARKMSAKRVLVHRYTDAAYTISDAFFSSAVAQNPPNLAAFSWFLQAVLKSHGGLTPSVVASLCRRVLSRVPSEPSTQWKLMVQRILVTALVHDGMSPARGATLFDWRSNAVVVVPLSIEEANEDPPGVYLLRVRGKDGVATFVRNQVLAPMCVQALLHLAEANHQGVAVHALLVLEELIPISEKSDSPLTQDHVVETLVRLVRREHIEVTASAMAILDKMSQSIPRFLLSALLRQCAQAAVDARSIVLLTNMIKGCLIQLKAVQNGWADVVGFIERHLHLVHESWEEASPQHAALLLLRHLCHLELRQEWMILVRQGTRTLDTTVESVCVVQLDILLWIVSHDDARLFKEEFECTDVQFRVARQLELPQRNVPSIRSLARQTLKSLATYLSEENVALD